MLSWVWEQSVCFKHFEENSGILQFSGTPFKRSKNTTRKEKSKNNYSTNILCSYYMLHSGLGDRDINMSENDVQYW